MEAKKNPSKDLSLQRNKFLLIGLSISISLAITAFEWRTVKVKPAPRTYNPIEVEVPLLLSLKTVEPSLAPQPIQKLEPSKMPVANVGAIVTVSNSTPVDATPLIDLGNNLDVPIGSTINEPEPEDPTEFFIIVEENPEPTNGYANFYKELSKNLKYPNQARRMGIEGKVFVEFIVNKNGEASDLKVIRGIGSGCDEEAMRVLSLTTWKPGKQRGKPVRVKMVMPISFMLSQ